MILLQSNLSGGWNTVWSSLTGGWPGLVTAMTVIGVILVLAAVISWLWSKKRGGSGNASQAVIWMLVIGGLLAAPTVLIPLILKLCDFLINIGTKLATNVVK